MRRICTLNMTLKLPNQQKRAEQTGQKYEICGEILTPWENFGKNWFLYNFMFIIRIRLNLCTKIRLIQKTLDLSRAISIIFCFDGQNRCSISIFDASLDRHVLSSKCGEKNFAFPEVPHSDIKNSSL